MSKNKFKFISIMVIIFLVIISFMNYKYHSQDRFWIGYFGKPYEMEVIKIDSFRLQKHGYGYYHTLSFNDKISFNQKYVELIPGNGKHQIGKKIKVNVLNKKASFTEKPSFVFSFFLGSLMLFSCYLLYKTFYKKI